MIADNDVNHKDKGCNGISNDNNAMKKYDYDLMKLNAFIKTHLNSTTPIVW